MIIISAGMEKSGSAYIYNLINDILIESGNPDARMIKLKYNLSEVMRWHNNNIGEYKLKKLIHLLLISLKEGKFAVKTHSKPTKALNFLVKLGLIKTIYIYRDPRDVLLSAQDHGKKIIQSGNHHTFAQMIDFKDAFKAVLGWVEIYNSYKHIKGVKLIKYEDLVSNPILVMNEILKFLKIDISQEIIENILFRYNKDNPAADLTFLHFNKAITNRYIDKLTSEQLNLFKDRIGNEIKNMGYKI